MLPYIQIGPITLGMYPLMYTIAILVGGTVLYFRPPGCPIPDSIRRKVEILVVTAILVGLAIPVVVDVFIQWLATGTPPGELAMRVYYGLGLGLLTGWIFMRHYRLPFLPGTDSGLPAFALAYSIARLGCLAAGCCGGMETDSFLAVFMPDNHGHWTMRYPTQLMSGAVQLLLFGVMLRLDSWLRAHRADTSLPAWLRAPGVITFGYIFFFCLERFSLDFLRYDHQPVIGMFSLASIYMLAGMLGSLGWFAWRVRSTTEKDVILPITP
jgi:phosphatidylglycerol:prolipoprotein diacylglycerol transferase